MQDLTFLFSWGEGLSLHQAPQDPRGHTEEWGEASLGLPPSGWHLATHTPHSLCLKPNFRVTQEPNREVSRLGKATRMVSGAPPAHKAAFSLSGVSRLTEMRIASRLSGGVALLCQDPGPGRAQAGSLWVPTAPSSPPHPR